MKPSLARAYRDLDRLLASSEGPRRPRALRRPRIASGLDRLAAGSGALVDRLVVRALEAYFVSRDPPDLSVNLRDQLRELAALYAYPELLAAPSTYFAPTPDPAEVRVRRIGRLPGGQRLRLTFRSTHRTHDPGYQDDYNAFAENRLNRIHLLQHRHGPRPTVVCVHAWCSGRLAMDEHLLAARPLYRLGLDVALFTMPFHGSRSPRLAMSGQLFPNRDLARANEAFGQAVADLRCLMRWLRLERRADTIGMLGLSLGGYTTALMAGLDDSLAFAVPMAAPCSFADVLWHHGDGTPARRDVEAQGFTLDDFRTTWAVHCPLMHPLRLPKERTLIIRATGDHLVPDAHAHALWLHWGQPQTLSYAGGHVLHWGRSTYVRGITRFLRRTVL